MLIVEGNPTELSEDGGGEVGVLATGPSPGAMSIGV